MNRQKKGEKMRRWEIKVGWSGQIRLEYEEEDREAAQEMAFNLAAKTSEPVTIRLIEEAETEDDIPVE